jgi:hypothetical protein
MQKPYDLHGLSKATKELRAKSSEHKSEIDRRAPAGWFTGGGRVPIAFEYVPIRWNRDML